MNPMTGLTVLVTGGTGGIGKATAVGLAAMGAHVAITGRDPDRAAAAAAEIRAVAGATVEVFVADLSSQSQVRSVAEQVLKRLPSIDVLVNNVGGFWATRHVTADGLERTFALNHLAPFLLTNLLLDRLHGWCRPCGHGVLERAVLGAHRLRRPAGGEVVLGSAGVQPVEARQRAVRLRAARRLDGSSVTPMLCTQVSCGPRSERRIRRRAALPRSLHAALHEEPHPRRGDLHLRGIRTGTPARDRPLLRGRQGEESAERSYDTAVAARLWRVSADLVGLSGAD